MLLVLALVATMIAVAAVLAAARPADRRDALPAVLWGAQVGDHLTGAEPPYDMSALRRFEHSAGKRAALVQWSLPWQRCARGSCRAVGFPRHEMEAVRRHGATPVFGWASYAQPLSPTQPRFRLSEIAAGRHDAFLRAWGRAAARWGHPFFLRFDWEMNLCGHWTYAECDNGNRPGDFVRAWRHVRSVVRDAGATNAAWVWCPNVVFPGSESLAALYPGDDQVDWTCLDGYNWAAAHGDPWRSLRTVFSESYDLLQRIAPSKPVMIAETASTERGGSKARWIRDGLGTTLPQDFPAIRALLYFDKYDSGLDWPIETSPAARAAFRAAIANPRYLAGGAAVAARGTALPTR